MSNGFMPGMMLGFLLIFITIVVFLAGMDVGRTGVRKDLATYGCEAYMKHAEAKP
jgi:hypothetical protein